MIEKIIIAGAGGQGIMLMGRVLALGALEEDKQVCWMPSYGAEVRGGTAHSMVIISTEEIASPAISNPTACIVMNVPSFIKFKDKIRKGGLMVVDSSLVKDEEENKNFTTVRIPATDIARELGNVRAANMVMLGAYLKKRGIISLDAASASIKEIFASKDKKIIELNELALKKGWDKADGRS